MDNENKVEVSEDFCSSCLSHIDTIQHISQLLTFTQGIVDKQAKRIDMLILENDNLKSFISEKKDSICGDCRYFDPAKDEFPSVRHFCSLFANAIDYSDFCSRFLKR